MNLFVSCGIYLNFPGGWSWQGWGKAQDSVLGVMTATPSRLRWWDGGHANSGSPLEMYGSPPCDSALR